MSGITYPSLAPGYSKSSPIYNPDPVNNSLLYQVFYSTNADFTVGVIPNPFNPSGPPLPNSSGPLPTASGVLSDPAIKEEIATRATAHYISRFGLDFTSSPFIINPGFCSVALSYSSANTPELPLNYNVTSLYEQENFNQVGRTATTNIQVSVAEAGFTILPIDLSTGLPPATPFAVIGGSYAEQYSGHTTLFVGPLGLSAVGTYVWWQLSQPDLPLNKIYFEANGINFPYTAEGLVTTELLTTHHPIWGTGFSVVTSYFFPVFDGPGDTIGHYIGGFRPQSTFPARPSDAPVTKGVVNQIRPEFLPYPTNYFQI